MKKQLLLTMICLGTILYTRAQITDPSPYCGFNTWGAAPINNVTLGSLDHAPEYDWVTSMYNYYNEVAAPDVTIGEETDMSITFGDAIDGEPAFFSVYIDLNHDNEFSDDEDLMNNGTTGGEFLPCFTGGDPQLREGTITIPAEALEGVTRMRIVRAHPIPFDWGDFPEPTADLHITNCNSGTSMDDTEYSYGEAVDYNVNLVAADGGDASVSEGDKEDISIYPNPVVDQIQLKGVNLDKIENSIIYTLNGEKVIALAGGAALNIENLKAGFYILEIQMNSGDVLRNKFTKI